MSEATVAGNAPIAVEVEKGQLYKWCSCGKSGKQPFCDGSHRGSEFKPVPYEATESRTLYFCACKQTGNAPLCDGSHQRLSSD